MSVPAPAFRVLCVDDDPRTRRAVLASLAPLKLEIHEASGRDDALSLARTGTFGLVLMDQVLEHTTGIELIAELKQFQPNALYALMTGVTDLNLFAGAVNSRVIAFIVLKPWHGEELREIVATAMQLTAERATPLAAAVPAPLPAPHGVLGRGLTLVGAVGMLISSSVAFVWNHRHEERDADALAAKVGALALRSSPEAVGDLAREGVAYVTVTEANGDVSAWAIDGKRVQVIGDGREAAIGLRESPPGHDVVRREVVENARRALVGVDGGAFAGSNTGAQVLSALGCLLALAVLAGHWLTRQRSRTSDGF